MGFLSKAELEDVGFRHVGADVLVSDRAAIYQPELISLGDRARVDDFCVLAGRIEIGRNVHIAVMCNLAGGRAGITMDDFSGLAYGCHLIAQSDDYSGLTLTNPTVPLAFKNETSEPVHLGRHVILGTGTVVLPGVTIGEGSATGALTMVHRNLEAWSIYVGSPARRVRDRERDLLDLEEQYLGSIGETGSAPTRNLDDQQP